MESCSCGKYQYGDEVKLPDPDWQYVKEGFMGTVYKCSRCGCLWFKTISSGIIGMPIYIKSKPDTNFGKPSPASKVIFPVDEKFHELTKKVYKLLKPLGYQWQGANYRLFGADGLCRIINFQRNKWNNTRGWYEFVINIGIYFEQNALISNQKFKEYDCQISQRIDNQDWAETEWWRLDGETNIEESLQALKPVLQYIEKWFSLFPSKEMAIQMILDGTAQEHSCLNVMHFYTAKLLVDMGYSHEVYAMIKDTKDTNPTATMLIEFAEKLQKTFRN